MGRSQSTANRPDDESPAAKKLLAVIEAITKEAEAKRLGREAERATQQAGVEMLAELDNETGRSEWAHIQGLPPRPEVSVYFIRSGDGPIKIGFTHGNPEVRLAELQPGNPYKLSVLAVIPDAGSDREHALHARFGHLRMEGEWFRPGRDLIAFIASRAEPWPEARILYEPWQVRSLDTDTEAIAFASRVTNEKTFY